MTSIDCAEILKFTHNDFKKCVWVMGMGMARIFRLGWVWMPQNTD